MPVSLLLCADFGLILLGIGLRRWMNLGDHFWRGIEKLVYFILFPALLFDAILRTRLELNFALPLIATALLTLVLGMLLMGCYQLLVRMPAQLFASVFQCGFRFNSYIGLATVGLFFGSDGIASLGIILSVAVPLANIASVAVLARHGQGSIWHEMGRNPLIIATVLALLLNVLGVSMPALLHAFAHRLGDASIALGLIAVGAALRFEHLMEHLSMLSVITAIKLIALPLGVIALAKVFGLTGVHYYVAIFFAALPTASSAYILAMRMGGDGVSVARLISASTLVSMLTLPLLGWYLLAQ